MATEVDPWDRIGTEAALGFERRPFYDSETDSLTFYFKNDESYRDRIDPLLTVYKSHKTDEIVGFHVKFVTRILNTFDNLRITASPVHCTVGALLMGVFVTVAQSGGELTVDQARRVYGDIPNEIKAQPLPPVGAGV